MEPSDLNDQGKSLEKELLLAPPAEQTTILVSYLGEVVVGIVDRPTLTEVRSDHRIFELGLGSLIVVELKNRLEKRFGLELPVALFFKHSTLGEIAEHLRGELLGQAGQESASASRDREAERAETPDGAQVDPGLRIQELSEEEAEAEMLAKLAELESKHLG